MNAPPKAPSTRLLRVLLVEDDPNDHRLVVDLLDQIRDTRFLIDWARNLASARDRLEHAAFDVCLLDLRLPDGDGLDLAAEADTIGLSLPIIPLTGFPTIGQDERALTLGAAGFLEKDKLDPLTLDRTIRYAIHQRKVTEGMARQAFVDERTGLIRPALYRERLNRALAFAKRRDRELAVMMIDLAFDPGLGDDEGLRDAALAAVGRKLAGALRKTDSIARLSDKRLALLIEGMRSLDHAATVARKTLRLLRQPIEIEDRTVSLAPSVGVAIYPREGGEGEILMRHAEAAMRRAIDEGRGCCRFSSERIDREAQEGIILEKAFSIAFEHRELRLRFHPEISRSGRVAGLAGAVFWRHPDKGWLPMGHSLADTDDETLIKGITDWSLAAAAEQVLAWQREGLKPPRLSLAFPFRRHPALALLASAVQEQVEERQVPPERIELDLQEDLVCDDTRRGCSNLASLKATGIRLALDDFGQGRVAIRDLRHDLLNSLKLSADLHRDLKRDRRKETLVKALINLGHNLSLDVGARGASDQRLFSLLKSLGCDSIQLTALSPMSADAATAWLKSMGGGEASQPRPKPEILVPKNQPSVRIRIKSSPPSPQD